MRYLLLLTTLACSRPEPQRWTPERDMNAMLNTDSAYAYPPLGYRTYQNGMRIVPPTGGI